MSNKSKNQASARHVPKVELPDIHAEDPSDHDGRTSEQAEQRAREQAMASRVKASSRTQMSVGQSKVQRIYKGNQPKG